MADENDTQGGPCGEGGPCPCPRVWVDQDGRPTLQGYEARLGGLAAPPQGEVQQAWPDLDALARLVAEARSIPRDPYSTFTHSAFRLEGLQQYLVDFEAERFQAFREGRPLPPRPESSQTWFRMVREGIVTGKRWHRVHVVQRPLSDYVRFEFQAYQDLAEAGVEVRIADWGDIEVKGAVDPAELCSEDFWLFDAETDHPLAIRMEYDADGRYLGYQATRDPGYVAECIRRRDLALSASVPFEADGSVRVTAGR
jgi:hypothetical protein